jgi:hypothetical protein
MSDYRLSHPRPRRPCRPEEHNFAPNGRCWRCDHWRDDLIQTARRFLELYDKKRPKAHP